MIPDTRQQVIEKLCEAESRLAVEVAAGERDIWRFRLQEALTSVREALSLLRAEQAETGWRPIETAPKDGTQVWLWWDGKRRLAYWHEAENPPSIGGRWFANWLIDDRGSVSAVSKPKLWQPLPTPPTEDQR